MKDRLKDRAKDDQKVFLATVHRSRLSQMKNPLACWEYAGGGSCSRAEVG